MSLSVCLIVRNEERNLARALTSVRKVADELIVIDTGSTDRTLEIARGFGATTGHFAWCDDFAAARNAALEQAKSDWVLWLDADEELLPESVPELRRCMQRSDALGFLVLRRDLVHAEKPDYFSEMWQLRLFRRRDDLRFRGRCHPDFHPTLQEIAGREGRSLAQSQILLRHYGYTEELRREKLERSRKLLELELRDRPGQLYYLIEFFRTLLLLGEERAGSVLTEAVAQLRLHERDARPPLPLVALLLETLLQMAPEVLPGGLTATQVRDLAQHWFPDAPPLLWLLAQQDFEAGRFDDAAVRLERLVRLGRNHGYDRSTSFDPRIVGDDAAVNLGVCLVRLGRLDAAERVFAKLLPKRTRRTEALANLAAIKELRRKVRIRVEPQG